MQEAKYEVNNINNSVTKTKIIKQCPYLGSIKKNLLDFDF
mgnify:CR=1 FL=1|jgi:hypothetical protein